MNYEFECPILLITFNRPNPTAEVLEKIRAIKPKKLYIASDFPRENNFEDIAKVNRTRELINSIDWNCEIHKLFSNKNLGCKDGPIAAINWFFENEEYGIILEDDCLPSLSFFKFCSDLLIRYKNDSRIYSVSGTNIANNIAYSSDYYFSKFPLMWGWATWRRAWEKYDVHLSEWPRLKKENWLFTVGIPGKSFVKNWTKIFDRTKYGRDITWWDYQWIYTCWIQNGLTIMPSKNLVRNIGFGEDATHTKGIHRHLSNLPLLSVPLNISHPSFIERNLEADLYIDKYWFGSTSFNWLKKILLKIKLIKIINDYMK